MEKKLPISTELKPGDPGHSYTANYFAEIVRLSNLTSAYSKASATIREDLMQNPDFENAEDCNYWLPVGWDGPDGTQGETGEMMKVNQKVCALIKCFTASYTAFTYSSFSVFPPLKQAPSSFRWLFCGRSGSVDREY
jgi:hypothetical protein